MKKLGYVIGLLIGIPVFIIIVNFLFFRGNNPSNKEVQEYISKSILDIIELIPIFPIPKSEKYIVGLSRRGRPSAYIFRYPFYLKEYKKNFVILMFEGFDDNRQYRQSLLGRGAFTNGSNNLTVRINQNQLNNSKYGTKENPVPVFPIDIILEPGQSSWEARGFPEDPFHVSEDLNKIFVEQYLKHFMPKEEFKEMFNK